MKRRGESIGRRGMVEKKKNNKRRKREGEEKRKRRERNQVSMVEPLKKTKVILFFNYFLF